MRYIAYSLLLILGVLSIQSCLKEEENIFGQSSAERLIEAQKKYDAILNSAENGWVMDYFAESEDNKLGGYQILCKFVNGKVTMAGAFTIGNHYYKYSKAGEQIASTYRFISSQGPVLSFDTYNPILHIFSDPGSSLSGDYDGYSGDFEFVVISASNELIVMQGLKHNLKIVMRPMEKGKDWNEYCDEVLKIKEEIKSLTRLAVKKSGKFVSYVTFWTENNEIHETEFEGIPVDKYTVTNKGINLYKPTTFGEDVIDYFDWDAANKKFVDANTSRGVELEPVIISYEQLLGTYIATADNMEPSPVTVTLSAGENGKIIVSKGIFEYPFEIEVYENNKLGIMGQTVHKNEGTGRLTKIGISSVVDFILSQSTAYTNTRPYGGSWYRGSLEKPELRFVRTTYTELFFVAYIPGMQLYESDKDDKNRATKSLLISNLVLQKQ